jgi:predicted Zn-dependent protease with MMP-like domain
MSTPEFEMVVSEAFKLTPAERTALMHELLVSLPAPECAQVGDLRDEDLVRRGCQVV